MNAPVPSYLDSVHHDGSSLYVVNPSDPGGHHRFGDRVIVRIRTSIDAPIQRVFLRAFPDGEQQLIEMHPERESPPCRWWRCKLTLTMPSNGYRFLLLVADQPWWYNGVGMHRDIPTDSHDFRILADYESPAWVQESVFYQIFPDRFARGKAGTEVPSPSRDRSPQAEYRAWGEPPREHGRASTEELFGGDIEGIAERLDYVTDLGADALYLNPIFTAYTNHRYDVADYYSVDSRLGGSDVFSAFRRKLKKRGIRLLLDIVPNHCGVRHPWFLAARQDPKATSAEFFTFYDHPDSYECWLGVKQLPKLNYESRRLRRLMYAGPKGVFRYWLRAPYSIDGWRIDVANMLARQGEGQLNLEILRGIRKAVKEENPSAYLMGENYFDASGQLQGDCLDGVMNYAGFTLPLWNWLKPFEIHQHWDPRHITGPAPLSTPAFARTLCGHRSLIPWEIARQQFNLLSSHDTPRILSIVKGNSGQNRLAAGLLMTYVGVPSIYYGDEVGMTGEGHMSGRACMPWDRTKWDEELREFYKKLVAVRRSSHALVRGGFQMLQSEGDTLVFLRDAQDDKLVVVAHRGLSMRASGPIRVSHGGIPDGMEFRETFTGSEARVEQGYLTVPSMSAGVALWRGRL